MCKVDRIIEKYGLSGLDQELERRHRRGASLRDLETVINTRVLEQALLESEVALVGDTESIYHVLQGDDETPGRTAEIRSQLERAGPPLSDVESDFVSHQTVKRHLQNCLGVDTTRQTQITLDDAQQTVEWAQSQNLSVIENTLNRLQSAGILDSEHIDVTQSVRVTCEHTGDTFRLREFLRRGGCGCEQSTRENANNG